MTRDEVLKEFEYTRVDDDLIALENEPYTTWHTDAMADEIVRLRTRVAWLENEIDHIDLVIGAATAYKSAAGRSDTAATAWAQQHLFDAVANYWDNSLDDDGTEHRA